MRKVDINDLNVGDETWIKGIVKKCNDSENMFKFVYVDGIVVAGKSGYEAFIKPYETYTEETHPKQHWSIVDDGGHGVEVNRIAANQVNIVKIDDDFYDFTSYLKTLTNYISYAPAQKLGKETDFGMVDADGNLYRAFWKGKADE